MSMKTDYGEALSMAAEQATEQTEAYWAWRANRAVEVYHPIKQTWSDLPPGAALQPQFILRRKSQPKLRPWKMEEVPIGARVRDKHCDWIGTIVAALGSGFIVHRDTPWHVGFATAETYAYSIDGGKTWQPCGVVE